MYYFKRVIEIEKKISQISKLAQVELDELTMMIKENRGLTLDEYIQNDQLFDFAFNCLKEENYEKAITLFLQVLAAKRNHVQSYGNIAIAHCALGNNQMALECLDKALAIDPNYEPDSKSFINGSVKGWRKDRF